MVSHDGLVTCIRSVASDASSTGDVYMCKRLMKVVQTISLIGRGIDHKVHIWTRSDGSVGFTNFSPVSSADS
jgi:hypothetical protein